MFILFDETKEAVIIDPGCFERFEKEELAQFIEKEKLKVVKLLNTHLHLDHIFGNQFVANTYNVKLESHKEGQLVWEMAGTTAKLYGFTGFEPSPKIEVFLEEGDTLSFGNTQLEVLYVPGHCPGHLAFVSHAHKFVIGGDVLFEGSIGRTDLPGGDYHLLEQSIRNKMYALPDDYTVYCGHGNPTTIGREKRSNAFVRG
jgi:glyoxylase-like metal-dependent hydrolase (beta-lactamase superfamily II)